MLQLSLYKPKEPFLLLCRELGLSAALPYPKDRTADGV